MKVKISVRLKNGSGRCVKRKGLTVDFAKGQSITKNLTAWLVKNDSITLFPGDVIQICGQD